MICAMGVSSVHAQTDLTEKEFALTQPDTTLFVSFFVESDELTVIHQNEPLDRQYWSFDSPSGMLTLSLPEELFELSETVTVRYPAPPLELEPLIRLREFREVEETAPEDTTVTETVARAATPVDDLFGDANITQSGSLTRGFTVGNRQDLSLDSGLRLDLSGNITDDVEILATLTDRSTPIQPDGTTQNIREFDRVYIQMKAPIGELEMGDVDLVLDQNRFARINRRVQGAAGRADTPIGEVGGGISVARGQFRSQQFNGIEGVQGPYRLSGAENEAFIIVLAGSESVYIDGQRVNRGEENEYIIDYSLGEITFTSNMVITDETRIIVEFQYITQNFTRTLFTAHGKEENLLNGRMNFGATYIREADDKNPNTQLNLTPDEIDRLRELGDDTDDFFVSGADSVGFRENADFILYARVDTTLNGEEFEIFKNIPGDPRGVFRVRFTNFGEGNGSYRRVGGTVNGILYEWAGPGQGSYEPVIRLQAPQSHQMVALNSGLKLTENLTLRGEWAVSEVDRNRFSETGSGAAGNAAFGELSLEGQETGIGILDAGFRQKYIGEQFEFFDRPREIEFDRRWNLIADEKSEEFESEAYLNLRPTERSGVRLSAGQLSRSYFDGRRAEARIELGEENLPRLNVFTEYVESDDRLVDQDGTWFRQRGELSRRTDFSERSITPFLNWEAERRIQRSRADSLLPNSLQFYDLNPGLRYETGNLTLEGGVGYRANSRPIENELIRESESRSQRFRIDYRPTESFRTENRLQFRQKQFTEAFESDAATPRSRGVLLRSLNNYRFRDYLDGELLYEANTERRALLQETYIEVGPELGQYVWIDLNNDGVQQLDEFFPEVNPNEGTFIRQFIPSDELFPVIDLNLRSRNEIRIGEILSALNGNDDNGSLQNLTLNSLIDIRETSTEENLRRVYLLDPAVFRADDTTITGQLLVQQRLRWHSSERTVEAGINYSGTNSLFQRSSGVEERKNRSLGLEAEYQLTGIIRIGNTLTFSENFSENSRFPSRNVDITGVEFEPMMRIFISRSAQTEFRFGYSRKENRTAAAPSEAVSFRIENSSQLYLFNRFQNMIRLQIRNTNVSGSPSGQAEFELTDGMGEGTNLVWNLNSSYRASALVRLSLQYSGRTTAARDVIQTMRLVVSAVF